MINKIFELKINDIDKYIIKTEKNYYKIKYEIMIRNKINVKTINFW